MVAIWEAWNETQKFIWVQIRIRTIHKKKTKLKTNPSISGMANSEILLQKILLRFISRKQWVDLLKISMRS